MKREELNYYDEFIKMAKFAKDISKTLKEYIFSYDYEIVLQKKAEIHEVENSADKTQHLILNYLIKDFVPPIDREDIIDVTRRLDDVIDNIDEVSIDLEILSVVSLREDMKKYMELMEKATLAMFELFEKFKDMKNYNEVHELVVKINDIEEQGDKLFQESIKNLYVNEKNSIEVIKWTAIYNRLEDCFDSIEHVADCCDEIFMKNS